MDPTNLYIFTAIIATGVYDIFCVYFTGPGKRIQKQWPSISMGIARIGPKAPWVYFVFGVAVGHLFFNMCQVETCLKAAPTCEAGQILSWEVEKEDWKCVKP